MRVFRSYHNRWSKGDRGRPQRCAKIGRSHAKKLIIRVELKKLIIRV